MSVNDGSHELLRVDCRGRCCKELDAAVFAHWRSSSRPRGILGTSVVHSGHGERSNHMLARATMVVSRRTLVFVCGVKAPRPRSDLQSVYHTSALIKPPQPAEQCIVGGDGALKQTWQKKVMQGVIFSLCTTSSLSSVFCLVSLSALWCSTVGDFSRL